MNWVDLCVILILLYFCFRGYTIGLLASLLNLLSTFLAAFVAFRFYAPVGDLFKTQLNASVFLAPILGFFALLLVCGFLFSFLASILYKYVYKFFLFVKPLLWIDKGLGVLVQVGVGSLLLTLVMTLLLRIPFSLDVKTDISNSMWGKTVIPQTVLLEPYTRQLLGSIPQETLSYLIPKAPDSEEVVKMNFPKASDLHLVDDPKSAQEMYELVNKERKDRGIKELSWDPSIVPVAVKHSTDMFNRSYFAHTNPDGKTSFDRMSDGEVVYSFAGENLAYAPSVEVAHKGLMNSPGHKENILRKEFGRIGIGVVDGGIYGKMFTQNFAD